MDFFLAEDHLCFLRRPTASRRPLLAHLLCLRSGIVNPRLTNSHNEIQKSLTFVAVPLDDVTRHLQMLAPALVREEAPIEQPS